MKYRYVVLRHQPSLYQSERESFAVLVEAEEGLVFAVGRSPDPTATIDPIGKGISEHIPELLNRIVAESLQPGENVLDTLSKTLQWNIQASKPETLTDTDPIHKVAFKLFSEHVAGADQLVNAFQQASHRMLRKPGIQRLGDTFQTVISGPETDVRVAAD